MTNFKATGQPTALTAIDPAFDRTRSPHPVPTELVERAVSLIDASNIAQLLDDWASADEAVVRSEPLTTRTLLAAWVTLALDGAPLTLRDLAQMLTMRLAPSAQDLLELPADVRQLSAEKLRGRLARATNRLLDIVDAYPLPTRGRALTKAEWEVVQAWRADHIDELEVRRTRFLELANRLLAAGCSVQHAPRMYPQRARERGGRFARPNRPRSRHGEGPSR